MHITLTTDDSFRPFFRRDSRLLKELLRIGAQAVQEVLSDLYPGMQIGLVYTVHTFRRDLGYKPHVHLVITKGDLVNGKWVEIEGIPANRLSAKWRYLLCKRLRESCPSDTSLQQVIAKTFIDHHVFMVHTESFYPKGIEAARYVGRYLGHPPTGYLPTDRLRWGDCHLLVLGYPDWRENCRKMFGPGFHLLPGSSYPAQGIADGALRRALRSLRYTPLFKDCQRRSGSNSHTVSSVRSRPLVKVRRTSEMARAHQSQFRLQSSCLPAVWPHNGTCRNLGA